MGRKLGAGVPLLRGRRGAGSSCNTMWPGPRPTPVPSGTLLHAAVWPQHVGQYWGAVPPFFWGGGRAGSPSNTMSPAPRSTSVPSGILIHPAVWPQQTCTKNWGCAPFGEGELGPHLIQCGRGRGLPHAKFYLDSSKRLHSAPTSQTDRTDRQRSDSIGRTVLQTVAQKHTGRNLIRTK